MGERISKLFCRPISGKLKSGSCMHIKWDSVQMLGVFSIVNRALKIAETKEPTSHFHCGYLIAEVVNVMFV